MTQVMMKVWNEEVVVVASVMVVQVMLLSPIMKLLFAVSFDPKTSRKRHQ